MLETLNWLILSLIATIETGAGVPLVMPNPDLIYPTCRGFGLTAGSLAVLLKAVLARRFPDRADLRFAPRGMPEPGLFEMVAQLSGSRHLVTVGDQIKTDILGAARIGIDSVLVMSGVNRDASVTLATEVQPTDRIKSLANLLKTT